MEDETPNKVYGIDLGTTYSAIACVESGTNNVTIYDDPDGDKPTASAVLFEGGGKVIVGNVAKATAATDPDNFVHLIKREMGTEWKNTYNGKEYTPQGISAIILNHLVEGVEKTGEKVKDVVITCPAYFNDAQREATKQAGVIARLNVLAVIDEPIAAAISYGMGMAAQMKDDGQADERVRRIVVYDLGGGTFDVTVVKVTPTGVYVVCTDGHHDLGGANWDEKLQELVIRKLKAEFPEKGDPTEDKELSAELRQAIEQFKKYLSKKDSVKIPVSTFEGKVKISVTREEFEEATRDLLAKTVVKTREMLDEAKAKAKAAEEADNIDEFLLVGGSTFMPQVERMVNAEFAAELGITPKRQDANMAVAKGAAIYGNIKAIQDAFKKMVEEEKEKKPDKPTEVIEEETKQKLKKRFTLQAGKVDEIIHTVIRTVASKSIGIRVLNAEDKPVCYNLIQKQTPVPCSHTEQFPVSEANATTLPFSVYFNNINDMVAELDKCDLLGEAEMKLDPGLPKGAPIDVTFSLDENGRLQLSAKDVTTGKELSHEFQVANALSQEEVEKQKEIVGGLKMPS